MHGIYVLDYWQRLHHSHCPASLRAAVRVLLLLHARHHGVGNGPAGHAHANVGGSSSTCTRALPFLPVELWLEICGFLCGVDF